MYTGYTELELTPAENIELYSTGMLKTFLFYENEYVYIKPNN